MPRYTAWVPTWASVKYVLDSEKAIPKKALKEKFENEAEPEDGYLCYQCGGSVEVDPTNIDWANWDGAVTKDEEE